MRQRKITTRWSVYLGNWDITGARFSAVRTRVTSARVKPQKRAHANRRNYARRKREEKARKCDGEQVSSEYAKRKQRARRQTFFLHQNRFYIFLPSFSTRLFFDRDVLTRRECDRDRGRITRCEREGKILAEPRTNFRGGTSDAFVPRDKQGF